MSIDRSPLILTVGIAALLGVILLIVTVIDVARSLGSRSWRGIRIGSLLLAIVVVAVLFRFFVYPGPQTMTVRVVNHTTLPLHGVALVRGKERLPIGSVGPGDAASVRIAASKAASARIEYRLGRGSQLASFPVRTLTPPFGAMERFELAIKPQGVSVSMGARFGW